MIENEAEDRIALIAEEAYVSKVDAITDRLRVTTNVEERPVLIQDEIERGGLEVTRIAVDRAVDAAPEPRRDGDTLIVSIVEERLVVEKRLFVVEELHVTRTATIEHVSIPETVRVMRATVEHSPTSMTDRDQDR